MKSRNSSTCGRRTLLLFVALAALLVVNPRQALAQSAPNILTSPADRRVLETGTTTFSLSVTGSVPLLYQWQKNAANLTDDARVSGSTNVSLTISNLQFADAGNYRVVVSNAFGVATSAVAVLKVATNLPPLSGSIGVWGDLDNDGLVDVLLAGTVQGVTNIPDGRFTRIYHNAGAGIFDPIGTVLPQLDSASAAWGDFNNDGKLDLLISGLMDGTNGAVAFTDIYRNDGSNQFASLGANLEPFAQGSAAWVDFDNDDWPDVFVSGLKTGDTNWLSRLYHNNGNGTFTLAITNLATPPNAQSYWADYDNDGDADLMQAAASATYLLRNEGGGVFTNVNASVPNQYRVVSPWGDVEGDGDLDFITSSAVTPSVVFGPDYHPTTVRNDGAGGLSGGTDASLDMWLFNNVSWGDIDNSGRACVAVSGWVPLVPGGGVWGSATKVYIYLGSSWQEVFTLGGWSGLPETWVDYDGDGALDIFTTGGGQTSFWKNTVALHRDFPQPPLNLTNTFTALDAVTLSWQSPSNTPATGRGLTYNVRIGHAPGGVDVVSPLADAATGRRLIQTSGNASTAHVFKLNDVPPGNYYWSVQSIGQSFTGSPFAAEGMFTVTSSPPVVVTQPTNQNIFVYSNTSFTVAAIGTKPLVYQWRKDGVALTNGPNVLGATGTTLTITNAQPDQSGDYTVVITNNYGSITSAVATLTVQSAPRMLQEPVNQYPLPTRDAAFTAVVAGALPMDFQWFFGGVPLTNGGRFSGAISPVLAIQNAQVADVGSYWLIASNSFGSVTSAVVTLSLATTRYVNLNNGSPAAPYTNWTKAATVIQDAIDVSGPGDEIIVTNGTYATGGRILLSNLLNRVVVDRPVTLRSVNGPAVTLIQGVATPASSAIRCAYLTNGATLSGFTLQSGGTRSTGNFFQLQCGGGALCSSASAVLTNCIINGCRASAGNGGGTYSGTLNNCTISGNTAVQGGGAASAVLIRCQISGNSAANSGNTSGSGGGAYSGSLTNCVITGNYARVNGGGMDHCTAVDCLISGNSSHYGGGQAFGTLINCTIVNNSAVYDGTSGGFGGGVMSCTVVNSILVQNTSGWPGADANVSGSAITYSCTPTAAGEGNLSAAPVFVNSGGGNFHLASGSPGINAGTNGSVFMAADLDGQPRIADGVVDMGAYEYNHAPFLIVSPVSQSVLLQSNVLFTASAVGDPTLIYQWQKDGTNLTDDTRVSGATTPSLSVSNLTLADGGGYRIVVTNASGSVTSAVATLTLLGLPIISTQPTSRSAPAGTNTTFSVTASGLAAISYQWRFGGGELLGRTNSSLSLTNIQSPNAGDYDVVLTNTYGAITSAVATLTVLPAAPTFTTQAVSRVVSIGQNASFTVTAKGSEPMTCQWQFNGTNLPGASGFTLTLTNVNSSFAGAYRAAVSNQANITVSSNATLDVVPVLMWGQTSDGQLQLTSVLPASATNVVAIAAGGGLTGLALRADGSLVRWGNSRSDIAIPTNATNLAAISIGGSSSSPNYLALTAEGQVLNWSGKSSATIPAAITNGNVVAVAAGATHQLVLREDGTVFAWGSNTSGQTNVPAGATNVIAIAAGTSHSLALRADGTVVGWGLNTSGQAAALSNVVNVAAIAAGGNQTLALLADGTVTGLIVTNVGANVSYGPPTGSISNKLGIAAGGTHSLAVNADRTATGWGATNFGQINIPPYATNVLAIAAGANNSFALVRDPFAPPIPPRIGRSPFGRALMTGQDAVFNALAVGGLPFSYQWLRAGVPVPGQTRASLWLTNVQPSQAGDYQLVALNEFGATTSAVATVTVTIPTPVLGSVGLVSNGFSFSFVSVAGVLYVIEHSSAPSGAAWIELERRFGVGGVEVALDPASFDAERYYRVRALFAPGPSLKPPTWNGSALEFQFNTVPGARYVLEYKNHLEDGVWIELSRQDAAGSSLTVTDPNPPGESRYYRLKVE